MPLQSDFKLDENPTRALKLGLKKQHRTFPPGARHHFQRLLTLPNSHPSLNCLCAPTHITSTIPGVSTSASKIATNWSGSQSRPELTQPQRHLFPVSGVTKHSGQPKEKHSKKVSSSRVLTWSVQETTASAWNTWHMLKSLSLYHVPDASAPLPGLIGSLQCQNALWNWMDE